MANRRDLKRNINGLLGDVIEECYETLLTNKGKNEIEIETIIDECVDLADDLIGRVNNLKGIANGKPMKLHFHTIATELEDKAVTYINQLNALA